MTIIEIASTEPPRDGKKLGKVTSADGASYHIWPDKLAGLKIGSRYAVEIEEQEFNGRPWKKITKAKPAKDDMFNGGQHAGTALPTARLSAVSSAPSGDTEWQFIREMLTVGLRTGAVAFSAHDLRTAIAMLRAVWKDVSC